MQPNGHIVLMLFRGQLDEDVRSLVKVKIIHGFWKNDDERKIALARAANFWPNVELFPTYMPYPFGTHHSKMLIIFRHDDLAQVIIHTANMISKDWYMMTQGVWRSPLLPQLSSNLHTNLATGTKAPIGSGRRFKMDLLQYLGAYGNKLKNLTENLNSYDFSSIRAAFIGSTPCRQKREAAMISKYTSFGWLGLQEILSTVPIISGRSAPQIVTQVSSIATLDPLPQWFSNFQSVLSCHSSERSGASEAPNNPTDSPLIKRKELDAKPKIEPPPKGPSPKFSIIFPTTREIQNSLGGYGTGGSIHMKDNKGQIDFLRPSLCHWSRPSPSHTDRAALRGVVAPHIKTYIRFSDETSKTIDWAMLTSANLSKQAWGDLERGPASDKAIWIKSYEAGVVVWPALFADPTDDREVIMVPTFAKDMPDPEMLTMSRPGLDLPGSSSRPRRTVVGFRMPYDLPLVPYLPGSDPWIATREHPQRDRWGQEWSLH